MAGGSSWKVAYADFMTAMMAFFLLLWILATASEETKAGLSEYFTTGGQMNADTAGGPAMGHTLPVNIPVEFYPAEGSSLSTEEIQKIHEEIADELARFMLDTQIRSNSSGVSSSTNGVLMTLSDDVLFEPGSVGLTPLGRQTLDEVVKILDTHVVSLIIRGHTSSDESGAPYPSKWDLASARANACLVYVQEYSQVNPSYLRASSYADTHPRYPETTAESREMNRRVEFYFFSPQLASGLRDF